MEIKIINGEVARLFKLEKLAWKASRKITTSPKIEFVNNEFCGDGFIAFGDILLMPNGDRVQTFAK